MKVSLVIPIFKNESNLEDLLPMLVQQKKVFEKEGHTLEPILVVDGSPDNCLEILLNAKSQSLIPKATKIIELSKNYGQVSAILAGLEVSTGNCSICYSADLQDPPELMLKLFRNFLDKKEIVIAVRSSREDNLLQNATSKIAYWLLRIKSPEIPKGGFDFFLLGNNAKRFILERAGSRRFLQGDILNLGFSPEFIKYRRLKRTKGKSSYTFRTRFNLFTDALFDSTDLFIKLATRIGFIIAFSGLISAIFVLIGYLKGYSPYNGFAAIFSSILVLGGFQLVMLGVIGEYIYRIYDIARNRPRYIIKNIF
jgi:dolichol-phosphate mannosyltransferase